jgi:anti-sigma regulatory factor (Ser/Thr protein kinase)
MEVDFQPATQFVLDLSDGSHAGEARRTIVRYAEDLCMGESDCGALAIAVTEMATNVLKHAGQGKMICGLIGDNGSRGLRVIAVDGGPGIRDIRAALRDGYSTAGTAGSGLGAVQRLATQFDIYTVPDHGTCVLAEFWPQKKTPKASPLQVGVVSVPVRGEAVSGDGWKAKVQADRTYIMVVDGLGHGAFASEAAREAERVLAEVQSSSPAMVVRDCHDALKKTRGAAVAVAAIDPAKRTLSFCGLGNISAVLVSSRGRRGIASHNGTAGHTFHRTQEFTLPWDEDSVLIMHTDGLSTRWDLDRYPGITRKQSSLIAAVLYRDFARQRDDATVLVAKNS